MLVKFRGFIFDKVLRLEGEAGGAGRRDDRSKAVIHFVVRFGCAHTAGPAM
ncbi:hypothetical protein M408DRAFT_333544, partial [Serendipita vermifera MAFF 305830]